MEPMRQKTEDAFKAAEYSARLLGDMKHGIYEVKTTGGLDEKTKLEALMQYRDRAEEILKTMSDAVGEAIYQIDQENQMAKVSSDRAGSHYHFCVRCGSPYPDHQKGCPVVLDMKNWGEWA